MSLATLASLAGTDKLVADLTARISQLEAEIRNDHEQFRHDGSIPEFIGNTGRKIVIRDEARGRLDEIKGTKTEYADSAAEILRLMLSASRRSAEVVAYLRAQRAQRLHSLEQDLADARAAIVDTATTYKTGEWAVPIELAKRNRASQLDVALEMLAPKEAAAEEIEERLSLLGGAGAYAAVISGAVQAAGGVDAVVDGIRGALGAAWFEGDVGWAAVKAAEKKAAAIEDRLEATDPDSILAAQIKESLASAVGEVRKAKASVDLARIRWARDIIGKACRGEPQAGAEFERIVSASPRSFAEGFAARVASARSSGEDDLRGVIAEALYGS